MLRSYNVFKLVNLKKNCIAPMDGYWGPDNLVVGLVMINVCSRSGVPKLVGAPTSAGARF